MLDHEVRARSTLSGKDGKQMPQMQAEKSLSLSPNPPSPTSLTAHIDSDKVFSIKKRDVRAEAEKNEAK
jgi:hypothetical protein